MRRPLLLPVPRMLEMGGGQFAIDEETRVCLMPGCGDAELEAALELARAIESYAETRVTVDRIDGPAPPRGSIALRLLPKHGPMAMPRRGEAEPPSSEKLQLPGFDEAEPPSSKKRKRPRFDKAEPPRPKKSLASILEKAGLIGSSMLEDLQEVMEQEAGMTLRKAVTSTGLVREEDILDALGQEMGMEKVALHELNVTPELLESIDPKVARTYKVFPVRVTKDTLYVALADPLNIETTDDLERILGKKVIGMVAPEDEIMHYLRRYYEAKEVKQLYEKLTDPVTKEVETDFCEIMGLETVNLHQLKVTPDLLAALDPMVARTHRVFPVRVTENTLHVAMIAPLDMAVIRRVGEVTGKKVIGVIAPERDILWAIDRYYEHGVFAPTQPPRQRTAAEIQAEMEKGGLHVVGMTPKNEEYILRISGDGIDLMAETGAGLFYGVQTLIQLVRQYGRRLPALRIEDEPDFRYRGYMLDVSRGRVPTLDHLKRLVDLLSHFKINMLQLYIEHTFHFRSHPEIGEGSDPLEPGEILELDRYCRSRHVELVPSLQSFGHMGRILSLPEFRHLAELPQFDDWEKAPWRKRLHGMTIAPVDEGTYALLADLYADFLPLFSSRLFNLNSDETWDLGKGRSREMAEREGVGATYFWHIDRIAGMARQYNRQPMVWSDIIYEHPELVARIPKDVVFLDWGYDHDAPFSRCRRLALAERTFFVCPGVSGWDQVFNDVWNATRNIRRFVAAGKRNGAAGVLNTDWGDCGHFNMPAASYHGAVLGAAMAWNEGRPEGDAEFDRAFSLHAFDDAKGAMGRAIRRAGSLVRRKVGRKIDTWTLWASDMKERKVGEAIAPDVAGHMIEEAADIHGAMTRCAAAAKRDPVGALELRVAVSMLDSLAARAEIDHKRTGAAPKRGVTAKCRVWAEDAARLAETYERLWLKRSKPARLQDILRVFRKQIRAARQSRKNSS